MQNGFRMLRPLSKSSRVLLWFKEKQSFNHNNNDVVRNCQIKDAKFTEPRKFLAGNKAQIMNNSSAMQKLKNIILPIGLHLYMQYVVRIANGSHSQTAFGLCT